MSTHRGGSTTIQGRAGTILSGHSLYRNLFRMLVVLLLLLNVIPSTVRAAETPSRTFTLQPTGKATISFFAFCTEFGDKYPDELELPSDLATPEVRSALQYIADNGLANDTNQALQAQYAIWNLLGQPAPSGDALAQQVMAYAQANPVSDPQATSLLAAASAGQVSLSLQSWDPASPTVQITATATDHFYGRGRLLVENTSDQPLTLYMPVGTLFHPTIQSHQTMAAYLSDVTVDNPNLPQTSAGLGTIPVLLALFGALAVVRLARIKRGRRISI
jgi:hypothetical protein